MKIFYFSMRKYLIYLLFIFSGSISSAQVLEFQENEKLRLTIEKRMTDGDVPDILLKDLKGNEFSLKDLKGKTIVIDFWATWCAPCIAAFPGMQNAIEKYKNDPDVEFLFIATKEKGSWQERQNKIIEILIKNNYDFTVLMDYTLPEDSKEFVAAKEFTIGALPSKIIISPKGRIKFRSVGYSGDNKKLVEELSLMIEMAKKS